MLFTKIYRYRSRRDRKKIQIVKEIEKKIGESPSPFKHRRHRTHKNPRYHKDNIRLRIKEKKFEQEKIKQLENIDL